MEKEPKKSTMEQNFISLDKIVMIDKNSLTDQLVQNQQTCIEKSIENFYDSIHQEDFVILRSHKYYLLNTKMPFLEYYINREISDDNFNQNIVSMSYNKNILLYVKNNGECFMTDGKSKSSEIKMDINGNTLSDFNCFTLKNAFKLSGSLNKKYLIKVACGSSHVVFLTHAGMVFSMGDGKLGQLGHNNLNDLQEPAMLTSLLNYRVYDVSVGSNHNLVLATMRDLTKKTSIGDVKTKEQNFVLAWGDNSKGQLGLGTASNTAITENTANNVYSSPLILEDFYNKKLIVKKIQTGLEHSLILLENGKLFGAGSNQYKQIEETSNENIYQTCRIKYISEESLKIKHNFINVKCSANSSLLITDKNYIILKGKIINNYESGKEKDNQNENDNNSSTKVYTIKFPEEIEMKQELNNIVTDNLSSDLNNNSELNLFLTDQLFLIFYDKSKIPINIEEVNSQVQHTEKSERPENSNKDAFHLKRNASNFETNNAEHPDSHNPDDTNFFQDCDISKEFFSDNASTNELLENNVSFEQSIEELRNYISLVGISFVVDPGNSSMSFRPKNLPKKTREEEEYHRKLVEENRRRYKKYLKDKQEEERKLKEKMDKKKEKLKKLQEVWEDEILPNWFKTKKDYNFLKKYFYEGIPTNIRGRVWLLCIGNHFSITPEYYEIEVKKAVNILNQLQTDSDDNDNNRSGVTPEGNAVIIKKKYNINIIGEEKSIRYIDLDIERTFPYLGIFKGNSPLGEDLREILQAFVVSRPDIGYIQGMSFIAGMLLLNMDKYQAFVALINITLSHNIIPFYRFDENQIRKRLQIFKQIFYHNLPELCDYFESLDILPEHYLIEWNMTLFSKNLNIDISARIWDIYMIDGIKAIYQAAIGKTN